MKMKEVESEKPQSFSGLSQKQLGESAEALRALDKEVRTFKRTRRPREKISLHPF